MCAFTTAPYTGRVIGPHFLNMGQGMRRVTGINNNRSKLPNQMQHSDMRASFATCAISRSLCWEVHAIGGAVIIDTQLHEGLMLKRCMGDSLDSAIEHAQI